MIFPTDREYTATKRIKQGRKRLREPFSTLARWIEAQWQVTVLNVVYDDTTAVHGPRVQVILEHERDARKFHRGINYDAERQHAIADKFRELIGDGAGTEYDVKGLFVVFSAFAPIAAQEADSRISEAEVKRLEARLGDPDLWLVSRAFRSVTFFFHTDEQARRAEQQGKRTRYAAAYFELLKPHDEFDYLRAEEFEVAFDSKENFDQNYQGSWFNYYR